MSDDPDEKLFRVPIGEQKELASRDDIQADISTCLKQIELHKMKIKQLRVRIRNLKGRKIGGRPSSLGSAMPYVVPKSVVDHPDFKLDEAGEVESDTYEDGEP